MPVIHLLNPNIVVLHGYETHWGGALGPLAEAVCHTALPILQDDPSKRAILVGGSHLNKVRNIITIAEAMEVWLLRHNIHPDRIITQKHFPALHEYMPPRDTWEEVILLKKMFGCLHVNPELPFASVACDFHIPRLSRIYQTYHLMGHALIPATPVPYKGLRRRIHWEKAARIIRFFDPTGNGVICHENRLKRTLTENKKPLIH